MRNHLYCLMLAAGLSAALAAPTFAAPGAWQVVSLAGSSELSSASLKSDCTVGQSAVGRAESADLRCLLGFWQDFSLGGGTPGCCLPPTVGDVDQSGGVDITDISVLIDNQFLTLVPLVCEVEGDCDFSGGVDISDLSILIDNQFLTLAPLGPCP